MDFEILQHFEKIIIEENTYYTAFITLQHLAQKTEGNLSARIFKIYVLFI